MRAMVVDDSKAMRMILKRLLTDCGYEGLAEAGDGQAALDLVSGMSVAEQPELILVDWNMPVMNGLEFVEAIRSQPRFRQTVLVMITTETAIERIEQALEAGADEYMMKPFTKEVLLEKLELIKSGM